ncbi:MAG: helix-turn-helix transcriptional regulator [Micavibrio aeruginosavorus]|uniref:Helix-turn-helix transcriptional regulator n=1 Tax=Micavibrio aeruginosavorus TaxID=349221 RepID=A0A7T5R320_9BACT|nr:MAG: helix-turn-helix transcriptional regulator [Micavibrio aeruginosavorus]
MGKANEDSRDVILGKIIRAERKAQGRSLEEVARAIGVSYQQVQKYESGSSRITVVCLLQIANFLNVPIRKFTDIYEKVSNCDEVDSLYDPQTRTLIANWQKIQDTSTKNNIVRLVENFVRLNSKSA